MKNSHISRIDRSIQDIYGYLWCQWGNQRAGTEIIRCGESKFLVIKNRCTTTSKVSLQKLRNFYCHLTKVNSDIADQGETILGEISWNFKQITTILYRLNCIFEALIHRGKMNEKSPEFMNQIKISIDICDAYGATKKLALKFSGLEKVNFLYLKGQTKEIGFPQTEWFYC